MVVDTVGQVPTGTPAMAQEPELVSHCSPVFHLGGGGGSALFVMGRVGERDVQMLIDTGAAVTLVHRKVLIGKGMSLKLKPVLTPVITASGEQLTIDGQGTAVFTLGRSVVEQD